MDRSSKNRIKTHSQKSSLQTHKNIKTEPDIANYSRLIADWTDMVGDVLVRENKEIQWRKLEKDEVEIYEQALSALARITYLFGCAITYQSLDHSYELSDGEKIKQAFIDYTERFSNSEQVSENSKVLNAFIGYDDLITRFPQVYYSLLEKAGAIITIEKVQLLIMGIGGKLPESLSIKKLGQSLGLKPKQDKFRGSYEGSKLTDLKGNVLDWAIAHNLEFRQIDETSSLFKKKLFFEVSGEASDVGEFTVEFLEKSGALAEMMKAYEKQKKQ